MASPARPSTSDQRAPARRALVLVVAVVAALAGCGREPTAPGGGAARFSRALAFRPVFPASYDQTIGSRIASIVPFTKVRVLFQRVSGDAALDTVVAFPADADSVAITFSVPLSRSAPSDGEPLTLALAYVNAPGDTVFRGGPLRLVAQEASPDRPPTVVSVPVVYTGPGANAKSVRIDFRSLGVASGETIHLNAVALDSAYQVIPNTPIGWQAVDTSLVQLALNGGGVVLGVRGAVSVVARLLTGPADTSALLIQPVPTALQVVSGDGQSGAVLSPLAQPIVVRALAADGIAVPGAGVAFWTADGRSWNVTANEDGMAATTWLLGSAPGTQTLTASPLARPAVTVAVHSVAAATPAKLLRFTAQPQDAAAGKTLTPPVVVEARDASDRLDASFTGPVAVQLAQNATGLTLDGTTTTSAVAGVATFYSLSVGKAGTGFRLVATTTGLAPDTSTAFAISAISTGKLAIASGDGQYGVVGGQLAKPLAVLVVDDNGKPVKGVIVAWSVPGIAGSLREDKSETDDTGIAMYAWTLGTTSGPQSVTASVAGLNGSPATFGAVAVAAQAARLAFAGQPSSVPAGEPIGAIVVVALDKFDNLATSFGGEVSLAAYQPGGNGGTLSGSTSLKATGGVATFGKLFLTSAGTGYVLVATSLDGLSTATSKAFDVSAAVPARLAIKGGDGQYAKLGQTLASPISVLVTDAYGNGVGGSVVYWRVSLGLGALAAGTSTTDAGGVATNSWTLLGTSIGLQQVTAYVAGLTAQSVVFSATAY